MAATIAIALDGPESGCLRSPAAPSSGKSTKLDAHLAGAGNDWKALEKLRMLAFAEQVPEPKRQMLLPPGPAGNGGEGE